MGKTLLFPAGTGPGCRQAAEYLARQGVPLTDHVSPEVTHLLLDIPTRDESWRPLLRMLPPRIAVIGGNLPELEGYETLDLLKEEQYLAQNAAITADCALNVARPYMNTTFADSRALVIGWGRIGKCLAKNLAALGCDVTVAARKESDRAMLAALGCKAVDISGLAMAAGEMGVVFNTVPAPLPPLPDRPGMVKVDLASRQGLTGEHVIWARGLPAIHAPETTGRLIASRILAYLKEGKE